MTLAARFFCTRVFALELACRSFSERRQEVPTTMQVAAEKPKRYEARRLGGPGGKGAVIVRCAVLFACFPFCMYCCTTPYRKPVGKNSPALGPITSGAPTLKFRMNASATADGEGAGWGEGGEAREEETVCDAFPDRNFLSELAHCCRHEKTRRCSGHPKTY